MKINKLTNETIKNIISVFLLFIITIGIFQYTVKIRKPWFGTLSAGLHQNNAGTTLRFSKNWYRESPLALKFGMIQNPKSIEFPTLLSRRPYTSYPPGAILPIYIISKLRRHEPTPSLLMKYNLLNHLFIAFFLSLIIFFFLVHLKFGYLNSLILSTVPISLELLLPAPLYWHQNVFFVDQAVILPFVLFIFFEAIRGNIQNEKISKTTNFLQSLVLFYGFLTDWLFVFIAITVYIKRILNGEIKKDIYSFTKTSVKYWSPAILALSLFTFQLYSLNGFPRIIRRFLYHTRLIVGGPGAEKYSTASFYNRFWEGHIARGYGEVAIWLLWGSLFLFILFFIYIGFQHFRRKQISKKMKDTLSLVGVLLIPCFMQIYFFKNHSWRHHFSALKFSIPLATVPFILIPILIFSFLKIDLTSLSSRLKIFYRNQKKEVFKSLIITLCIIISVGIYLKNEHPRFESFFPEPNKSFEEIGEFISTNTEFRDIVFSPNFEIPLNPAQQLSYSMKRVYKVVSIFDIYSKVNEINRNFEINIFSIGKLVTNNNYGIKELISAAYDVKQVNDLYYLYRIKKEDFIEKYNELKKVSRISMEVNNRILNSNDLFDLYEVENNYSFIENIAPNIAPKIYERLNKKYQRLSSYYDTEDIINEKVSFVDYRYKKLDGERYKFYILFKVNGEFEKNWRIYIHAHVKDKDVNLLPKRRQRYKYCYWYVNPDPPTSLWHKNEYIVVAREISAKPILYNVNIGFFKSGEGRHGKQIKLGWLNLGDKK